MTVDSPLGEVFEQPAKAAGDMTSSRRREHVVGPLRTDQTLLAKSSTNGQSVDAGGTSTWQASSFDLLTGATAEELTDTIPGDL